MKAYPDRRSAGRVLARALADYTDDDEVVVLAMVRGGVPVAYEVAQALHAPLDVMTVRNLEALDDDSVAIGAIAAGGVRVLDNDVIDAHGVTRRQIETSTEVEVAELRYWDAFYRKGLGPFDVTGKVAILIDDGSATPSSLRAAVTTVRSLDPKKLIVAVAVGPAETCSKLRRGVDDLICGATAESFGVGGGPWYDDFHQVTDEEVRQYLAKAGRRQRERTTPHT